MNLKKTLLTTCLAASLLAVSFVDAAPAPAAPPVVAKVNVNKAEAKDLMAIQGMSAYKAHAIVACRHKNGDFKNLAELEKVKGFKRMTAEGMKAIADRLDL